MQICLENLTFIQILIRLQTLSWKQKVAIVTSYHECIYLKMAEYYNAPINVNPEGGGVGQGVGI